jgi:CDP-paratose 2-epimerase
VNFLPDNILVTGGAGFVGSHVAEFYSRKKDAKVTILDGLSRNTLLNNDFADPMYNWNRLTELGNVSMIKGDIREYETVKKAAKGADAIIHIAGQVAVTSSLKDPRADFEVNALGTLNVLEAARANDAAVVFTSTNKVYGENVNKIPVRRGKTRYEFSDKKYRQGIPEGFQIDLAGHSPYGCSKLAADIYVQDYADSYGMKTGVFRMSCIYGDRQFGIEDQGWVAWFTIATLLGKKLTIYGDGRQVRDVLYVDDLVRAFDLFLKRKSIEHEVFNMGGGIENTLSLLELLDILRDITGKNPEVTYSDWRTADQKVYISNISKAKKLLGWEPKITPKQGVEKLSNWAKTYFKTN